MYEARWLRNSIGSDWIGDFPPYGPERGPHPLGIWRQAPPRGTGTDDMRNNQMFVECVVRNRGFINSQLLAIEYIERYRDRESFYPGYDELAERFMRGKYRGACAYLGMRELPDGNDGPTVLARGNGFPMLGGLISLAPAGLLYAGDPEAAYCKAFELAYFDMGYARDATAMMAAMVSAALGGGVTARQMVEAGLQTDPHGYGEHRLMVRRIRRLIEIAHEATDDRDLVDRLSPEVSPLHLFDPIDILGVPVAGLYFADGDPARTIAVAANDRDLNPDGSLDKLRDVDCTGGVAGALVGALRGVEAFPEDWVNDTLEANREVYGIDIEENARRFTDVVHGG